MTLESQPSRVGFLENLLSAFSLSSRELRNLHFKLYALKTSQDEASEYQKVDVKNAKEFSPT
jgi:hypothetical protein